MIADREITLQITPKATQLNLWQILLGQSTISRKTAALDQNKIITTLSGLDHKLGLNDATPEAFIADLQYRARQNLIWDEIGGFFSKAKKRYMDELPSLMCELYDCPEKYERKLRKDTFFIEKVYLSLIGATTPETFRKTTNEDDFTSGFFYRTMFIYPERKKIRKRISKIPEQDTARAIELAEWLSTLYKFIKCFKKAGIELQMEFEPEGLDEHDKWCSQYETYFFESDAGKEMQAFFGRMQINALKVAALLYLGSGDIRTLMESVYTKGGEGDEFTKFTKFTDSLSSPSSVYNSPYNYTIVKLVNLENRVNKGKIAKIIIPSNFVKIGIYYASRLYLPYNAKVLRLVQTATGADLERVYNLAVEHAKAGYIEHSDLLHRAHIKSKDFREIVSTLQETGRFFVSNKNGKIVYTPIKSKLDNEVKAPEVDL